MLRGLVATWSTRPTRSRFTRRTVIGPLNRSWIGQGGSSAIPAGLSRCAQATSKVRRLALRGRPPMLGLRHPPTPVRLHHGFTAGLRRLPIAGRHRPLTLVLRRPLMPDLRPRYLCVRPPPCGPFRMMAVRPVCRGDASRRRRLRRISHPSRRCRESKKTGHRRRRPSKSCRRAVRPRRAVHGQRYGHRFRACQPLQARRRARYRPLRSKPAALRQHVRLNRAPALRASRRRKGLSRVSFHLRADGN